MTIIKTIINMEISAIELLLMLAIAYATISLVVILLFLIPSALGSHMDDLRRRDHRQRDAARRVVHRGLYGRSWLPLLTRISEVRFKSAGRHARDDSFSRVIHPEACVIVQAQRGFRGSCARKR